MKAGGRVFERSVLNVCLSTQFLAHLQMCQKYFITSMTQVPRDGKLKGYAIFSRVIF